MKDKIIEQLSEKKNQNGAEAFFLICANAENLSPQFRKTFNAMLRHFEAIEQLKLDQEKREQSIKEAYASLTLSGNFHEETAKLIAKKTQRERASKSLESSIPTTQGGLSGNRKEEVRTPPQQSVFVPPPSSISNFAQRNENPKKPT